MLLGTAYKYLTMCKCREALEALNVLPSEHANSAWARTVAGRAYFEMVDYKSAADAFEDVCRLDPSRIEGMEVSIYQNLNEIV